MSDLDIINSLSSEPVRPLNHVSIEEIITSVPCMTIDSPATYALYIHYNKEHLEEAEVEKVNTLILRLQTERSLTMKRNIEYMDRDLSGGVASPNDAQ